MRPGLALILAAFASASVPLAAAEQDALGSLVEAELEFSRTSEARGIKESFLAFFAPESVLFRPGPVPAREWLESHPATPGVLTWYPIAAELAASGELGWTTGPWEYRERSGEAPAGHGQFFSIWRRQDDGAWKVVADMGSDNEKPAEAPPAWTPGAAPARWQVGRDPEAELPPATALQAAETGFGTVAEADGGAVAYAAWLAPDARLLRQGRAPAVGSAAFFPALSREEGAFAWNTEGLGVSRSGDLGYTFGSYRRSLADGTAAEGHYLRAWRREPDGSWKVVVDLLAPLPPPAPPPP